MCSVTLLLRHPNSYDARKVASFNPKPTKIRPVTPEVVAEFRTSI
jgi:hypothetical protein